MSPGVECLTLDRKAFKQHIGDLEELHERDYGDHDRIYAIRQIENRQIQLVEQEREIARGNKGLECSGVTNVKLSQASFCGSFLRCAMKRKLSKAQMMSFTVLLN